MNNILDDNSIYEEAPMKPKDGSIPKNKLVAFLWQLFAGRGLFYVDNTNRFRWFYLILFIYGITGVINMICWANFRLGFSFLANFQNRVALGAFSLLGSILIAYPIAFLHINWLINKQRR